MKLVKIVVVHTFDLLDVFVVIWSSRVLNCTSALIQKSLRLHISLCVHSIYSGEHCTSKYARIRIFNYFVI